MRSSEPVMIRKGRVGLYEHETIFLMWPPPTSPTELPESHMITWHVHVQVHVQVQVPVPVPVQVHVHGMSPALHMHPVPRGLPTSRAPHRRSPGRPGCGARA